MQHVRTVVLALLRKRWLTAKRDAWTTIPHAVMPVCIVAVAVLMVQTFATTGGDPALHMYSALGLTQVCIEECN